MTRTKTTKGASKARTDEKTVARAVELRKQGLGLPTIAKKLTEEGHKSARGKELRPQTIRQWLLRELKVGNLQRVGIDASAVHANDSQRND